MAAGVRRVAGWMVLAALMVVGIAGGSTATGRPGGARAKIVAQDAAGLTLELRVGRPTVRATEVGGRPCYQVTAPGLSPIMRLGLPAVPGRGELVAVPSGEVRLEVEAGQAEALEAYPLCPAATYLCGDGDGAMPCLPQEATAEPTAPEGLFPGRPAELGESGVVRGQKVVRVQFYPIQVDTEGGRVLFHPVVRVRLAWDAADAAGRPVRTAGGPFDEVLRSALLNEPGAVQAAGPQAEGRPGGAQARAEGPAYKVAVEQDGPVQITAADLAAAGWDPAQIDPATLKLSVLGTEVPLWVEGEEDGRLDPGDAVVFYGRGGGGPYSARTVYWLTAGGAPGARMAVRDVSPTHGYGLASTFPATVHAEGFLNPLGYWQNPPGREAQDHWYWARLTAPASAGLPFRMPALDPGRTATLRVLLAGATDDGVKPDHHTRLLVNGTPVGEAWWDGKVEYLHTASLPASLLAVGDNTLTVESIADTGATVNRVYVNWLEVDYAALYAADGGGLAFGAPGVGSYRFEVAGLGSADLEAFDITEPAGAVRLSGLQIQPGNGGFTAILEDTAGAGSRTLIQGRARRQAPAGLERDEPSSLRDGANGADEIMIVYDGFYTDTLPLAVHRQAQGLRVAVVRISDVYDEFSGGMVTPQAIRDFLAYAYAHWAPPAPTYALLVGDAHLDWLDRFDTGSPILVPTAIFDALELGETANETWLACVDGDDPLPDLLLGRLSAQTGADVRAMVGKILAYEANPAPGPWAEGALFVADDDLPLFEASSEGWIGQLPAGWQPQRVYAADYPPGDPQADIVAAVNDGVAVVSYAGHGYYDRWGSWSGGRLFDTAAVAQLTNGDRLPLVVTATCLNGFFVNPFPGYEYCLAEELARHGGGGAIAAWSPTAMGFPAEHQVLFEELFDALFAPGARSLGGVTTAAKLAAYGRGVSDELIETYALFGDPAVDVPPPSRHTRWLPVVAQGFEP